MKIGNIIELLENRYPLASQMDFDNSGANIVNFDDDLKNILVCLDITLDTIKYAAKNDVNLIISHHPIIFNEIKNINADPLSKKIKLLIKNNISAYSMHTNFDVNLKYGMWTALKKVLFDNVKIKKEKLLSHYSKNYGLGNILYLKNSLSFGKISDLIIDRLSLDRNKVSLYNFSDDKLINKIIILAGSGSGELEQVICEKPDLFITSDLKHNQIIDLYDSKISYISATHYGLEKVFIPYISEFIEKKVSNKVFSYYFNYL